MAPRLKKITKGRKKATSKPVSKYLTPTRCVLTPAPASDIIPRQHALSPLYDENADNGRKQEPKRKYYNRAAHPEFQDINLSAGYHSALMKQLEICEELQRAQIDISIAGLPKAAKDEMSKKYEKLI